MSGGCCGTSLVDVSREDFVAQFYKLLPDFQGHLNPDGNFVKIVTIIAEAFYDEVVTQLLALEAESSPCSATDLIDEWVTEYSVSARCSLAGVDDATKTEIERLLACIQFTSTNGGAFNRSVLDQIADVLGVTYTIEIPTYDLANTPFCDIILMPPLGDRCTPQDCNFIQAVKFYVTAATSDAHYEAFQCIVAERVPCHVAYCILDERP